VPAFGRLTAADLTNLAVEAPDTPMHVGALAIVGAAALFDHAVRADADRYPDRPLLLDAMTSVWRMLARSASNVVIDGSVSGTG
jgi:hypothetical protein